MELENRPEYATDVSLFNFNSVEGFCGWLSTKLGGRVQQVHTILRQKEISADVFLNMSIREMEHLGIAYEDYKTILKKMEEEGHIPKKQNMQIDSPIGKPRTSTGPSMDTNNHRNSGFVGRMDGNKRSKADIETINEDTQESQGRVNVPKKARRKPSSPAPEEVLSSMVSFTTTGQVLSADESFAVIFGFAPNEIIGKSLNETILPTPYSEACASLLDSFLKTGRPQLGNRKWNFEAKHKNGEIMPIIVTLCELGQQGSKEFLAILEKGQPETCTISFDEYGNILLCRSANKMLVEFFGFKDVAKKKITDLVPDLLPRLSNRDPRPNYLYLRDEADPRKVHSMNVKVLPTRARWT